MSVVRHNALRTFAERRAAGLVGKGFVMQQSLPARERGLKRNRDLLGVCGRSVAPRAGAWIETLTIRILSPMFAVAPRAGAWIETFKK